MRISSIILVCLFLLFQMGCANIKLVSSEDNKYKFCTNPGNKVVKPVDFDAAASKQCDGKYRNISRGEEFFTEPGSKKIGGLLEVQTQRRMCSVYECTK